MVPVSEWTGCPPSMLVELLVAGAGAGGGGSSCSCFFSRAVTVGLRGVGQPEVVNLDGS